jgi:hypothetical protein
LAKRRLEKKSALLSVVSVSYEPEFGRATAKIDVAWLDRKTLGRICRIIQQQAKADGAKTSL